VHVVNLLVRLADTKHKNRALFEAVEGGPVVVMVIDAPVHPNQIGTQPAELQESWSATVETLLNNGADIEAKNEDGSTPLDWAAAFAQTDILKLLIQRGAKTNVTDRYGNTPLISAACECAVATMNSAYDVMKILLDQGANVNARNKDGKTALMMASGMTGDAAVLGLLLQNGADPLAKDHKGNTALSLAKQSRREDKMAILKSATVH
jgi:ankyrin repeat protein